MILTVVSFIVIFSIVILIHELGHFYFARKAGMRVEELGIGLPPRIWGTKKGETIYSINWIPVGGFVRVYGEGGEHERDERSFASKTAAQRIWFIVGGVLMNFLLAVAVLMVGFWLSMPPLGTPPEQSTKDPAGVTSRVVGVSVDQGSPAQAAGILMGDLILSVDGDAISTSDEGKAALVGRAGQTVSLLVDRSGKLIELTVVPRAAKDGAQIGAIIDRTVEKVLYIWWQVPWIALQEAWRIIVVVVMAVVNLIYQLFKTASIPADLGGPVGIAKITADILHLGWLRVLQ